MKAQQVSKLIRNANIDLTIRKAGDFKPRKGFKLVHEEYVNGVAPTADSMHRILGRAYFWGKEGTKELFYVIEVPANEAVPLNRLFENEKGEYRREHRHRIWNEKRTKLIMCPYTNSCSDCPFKDKPEEIFPSEAEMLLSYEDVNQDKVCLPDEAFGSEKCIFYNSQEDEMLTAIKSDEAVLFKLVSLNRQGYELAEIMETLNLVKEDLERLGHKLEKYVDDYID
ncbi:MAG: hypothetical protein IJI65_09130 [Lachnospiraceae bacterium]|nr:hypothetical protein [Lachnospiraceae bacterium]